MTNVYTVLDIKAECYLMPFYSRSDAEAVRLILGTCEDPKTQLAKYPLDFKLVKIGTFEQDTGVLCPCPIVDLGSVYALLTAERKRYEEASKESEE